MIPLFILPFLTLDETPEKTVQSFVAAFNAHDAVALGQRVIDGKSSPLPFGKDYPTMKASLGELKIEGDSATVEADVTLSSGSHTEAAHESIHLQRANGDWRIVTVNPDRVPTKPQFVGMIAYMAVHPELMLKARLAAKKTVCLSNVKQLTLGTIMYSGDHDDVLPKAAAWKSSIMPYVKSEAIFHCPEDASGNVSYFLDPRLSGKSLVSIPVVAETAMIVEGTPKKTAFRHDGRCSIGFTDGHAKIVDPATLLKARTISLK